MLRSAGWGGRGHVLTALLHLREECGALLPRSAPPPPPPQLHSTGMGGCCSLAPVLRPCCSRSKSSEELRGSPKHSCVQVPARLSSSSLQC